MRVLFLVAHPDDEAYGPFGTIHKLVEQGHHVEVYSMCNGKRPGSTHVSQDRVETFKNNCETLGVKWKIWDNNDLTLVQQETNEFVSQLVELGKFEVVYTHNISDLNNDHRVLAEAALVACRPKPNNTVNKLYFFEVPSSTDWTFLQVQPVFEPNTYVAIDEDVVGLKERAMASYSTETYEFPDARSTEAMITLMKYRGYQTGFKYAEAFKLVFSREQ